MSELEAEPIELDGNDFRQLLEERVQASLGMSVGEFVLALREHRLDPESPRIAGLAILVGARTHQDAPAEARKRYIRFLQLPLSCLTKAIWITGDSPGEGEDSSLTTSEEFIRLKREGREPLFLEASQRFELVPDHRFDGEWKSKTLAYIYSIRLSSESEEDAELMSWHWHPLTTPGRSDPHTHVRSDNVGLPGLGELHIPSRRVAFEEVAYFLIADLG